MRPDRSPRLRSADGLPRRCRNSGPRRQDAGYWPADVRVAKRDRSDVRSGPGDGSRKVTNDRCGHADAAVDGDPELGSDIRKHVRLDLRRSFAFDEAPAVSGVGHQDVGADQHILVLEGGLKIGRRWG